MIPKRLVRSSSKKTSLFTAVIGQMAQSFVIGLPHTVRITTMGGHYANVLLRDVQSWRLVQVIGSRHFLLIDNNFIYCALSAS